jgi:cyclin C
MEETGVISRAPIQYDMFMRIYIHSLVNKLGRRLNIRQLALSTAEVYLMRFLTKVSLKEVNLYLLITTCIYLSCKIEECPQHIRTIVSEARNLWPEYIPHDAAKLAEFEFYLIEELDTHLIVHHPYKSLLLINEALHTFSQKQGSFAAGAASSMPNTASLSGLTSEELQSSWSIINDSYVTDLPLLYPPHVLATAAIYLTIVLKNNRIQQLHSEQREQLQLQQQQTQGTLPTVPQPRPQLQRNSQALANESLLKSFVSFLGHSNIDFAEVAEVVQELITLYEIWESYDETSCKKPLELVLLNR